MRHHQRGQLLLFDQLPRQAQDLPPGAWIERGGMFVKKKELWLPDRRHEERQRLTLAAGKLADFRLRPVLEPKIELPELRKEKLLFAPANPPVQRPALSAADRNRQVLFDRHVRGGPHHRVLKNAPDPLRPLKFREIGNIDAVDRDRPGVQVKPAGDRVQ